MRPAGAAEDRTPRGTSARWSTPRRLLLGGRNRPHRVRSCIGKDDGQERRVASLWRCKFGSRWWFSLGGCHLLGDGLFVAGVAHSLEALAVECVEVDAVGL